ncbi:MAG: hypothetical protein M3Z64_06005 [Verrucomicrobiota bacterium]|nr:hypothetical protein [Verrucomicrobiota bacterium]
MRSLPRFVLSSLFLICSFAVSEAQTDAGSSAPVRVTVSMNSDGSRTAYEWDTANHKATGTTTDSAGKLREKILYQLDADGRFASGEVFGPKNTFRFTTRYKYEASGRLAEETQLSKDGAVQHRIVYAYDAAGKQTGYSVFDAAGKLIGQTGARPTH